MRRQLSLVFLVLGLMAPPTGLFGAEGTPPSTSSSLGNFLFRHYQVRDGLIQEQVAHIFQDSRGYIWIGTFGGLSLYDGKSFTSFSKQDGIPAASVDYVSEDSGGRIWVATALGAAVMEHGKFRPVKFRSLQKDPAVFSICRGWGRTTLFGTREGLLVLDGEKETLIPLLAGPKKTVQALFPLTGGGVLAASREHLFLLRDGGKFQELPMPAPIKPEFIYGIGRGAAEGTFVLARDKDVILFGPGGKSEQVLLPLKDSFVINDAIQDSQGILWIATNKGLWSRRPGAGFQEVTLPGKGLDGSVFSLREDYEGSLWVGFGAGLAKLSARQIRFYATESGLLSSLVWGVAPFQDGTMVFTGDGLQFLKSGRLDPKPLARGMVVDACSLPDGRILFAGSSWVPGLQIREKDGSTHLLHDVPDLVKEPIGTICPLSSGDYLLLGGNHLYVGTPGRFRPVKGDFKSLGQSFLAAQQKDPDTVWVGGDNGIIVLKRAKGEWELSRQRYLEGKTIQCFLADGKTDILVGTLGTGILRYDGRGFSPFSCQTPQSDNIWALFRDRTGTLWAGTSRGAMFRKGWSNAFQPFNVLHGIPQDEISSPRSFWQGAGGELYIATTQGLLECLDPEGKVASVSPRLDITRLQVAGKDVPVGEGSFSLRHDQAFSVSFRVLSFINENGNRFQFYLEGSDGGWSPVTTDDHVSFPYLPTGTLRFRLRGYNSRGVATEYRHPIVLEVQPPFTRTIWFYLLLVLGVGGGAGMVVWMRLRHVRKERNLLRDTVAARTAELQASEEKYRSLVDGSLVAICILQDGRIVFANPTVTRLTGFAEDQILGQGPESFIYHEDLAMFREQMMLRDRGDRQPHEYEIRLVGVDGKARVAQVSSSMTLYQGRPAILVNAVDVTEKKRMQEQLIHYQKLDSIGTLAGGIAHDFNNILQGITGVTSLVRMQLPPDATVQGDLNMIEEAAAKAATLTRKLLGFARKGKYVVQVLDLHSVVESVMAFSRRTIPLDIRFETAFAGDPLYIQGDRGQIEQVFLNLFLNARDAMPDGGCIRVTTQRVSFGKDVDRGDHVVPRGPYVEVTVEDTGGGMPPEVLAKVFDPFFTTKPLGKGTGLGLATVYGIIKNHQGFIYFTSKVNEGSAARIYFPASSPPGSSAQEPATDRTAGLFMDVQGHGVLVVEDESINRQYLRKLLSRAGMTVFEAENGQHALKLFGARHSEIDLVLLDVNMPVLDGLETLRGIQEVNRRIPVIVLSGYEEGGKIQSMKDLGAANFIQKPIDSGRLLAMVSEILLRGEGQPE